MSIAYDVVPVTLVTGFLGSGKSTLLADVLKGNMARDTAVLVNEFGEIGLDHLLVGEVRTQTVLLENGCMCCSIRGELSDALRDLFSRRVRGELPPFKQVVIETTGLAMPAPIIATLLADAVVRNHYVLRETVTLVDAIAYAQQRERYPEWYAQVSAADRLLISKADLVDEAELRRLREVLASINPVACVCVRDAQTGVDSLLGLPVKPTGFGELMRRVGQSNRCASLASANGESTVGRAARAEHLTLRVHSFCLEFAEPIDWEVFTIWFTMLLNRHGENILRVKGVLWLIGSERPIALHATQHLVHPVLHLEKHADQSRVSQIVFIVEELCGDAVCESYARFARRLGAPVSCCVV